MTTNLLVRQEPWSDELNAFVKENSPFHADKCVLWHSLRECKLLAVGGLCWYGDKKTLFCTDVVSSKHRGLGYQRILIAERLKYLQGVQELFQTKLKLLVCIVPPNNFSLNNYLAFDFRPTTPVQGITFDDQLTLTREIG